MVRTRPSVAKHQTRSALVVLPDSDGLLLTKACRFVAPCFQPWGSSRFLPRLPLPVLQPSAVLVAFPELALHTLQSVPLVDSRIASPQPLPFSPFNRCLSLSPSTPKCFSLPLPTRDLLPCTQCCHQCCSVDHPVADLKALLHRRVRCRCCVLPLNLDPILSWALFPSRALPPTAVSVHGHPASFSVPKHKNRYALPGPASL